MTCVKRIILIMGVILVAFNISALAASISGQCGDNVFYTYDLDSYELTITGTGLMAEYTQNNLPPWCAFSDEIKNVTIGEGVTSIGAYAFYKCTALEEITISGEITTIGESAFYDCSSLDMIMLPDTVEELGYGAFYGCSSFTDVQLPDSLETIDNAAFMYCTKLETIDLSDSLMSIGGQAFSQCYKLRELSLPASLQTIEFDAFSDCKTLEELIIPLNVSSIGHGILNGTNDLQRVLVDINNQHYKSIDNVIYTRDGTKLVVCPGGMTNLTIADGTVEVLDDAGMNSANLTSISIPEGVTTIGRYAFRDCTKLTDISLPLSMETISLGAFEYCSRLANIHYAGSEDQWLQIEIGTWNDYLLAAWAKSQEGTMREGTCGENLQWYFDGQGNLSITGEGKMTEYEENNLPPWCAFSDEIKNVTIGEGVTSIGAYAFYKCTALEEITISGEITTIGESAFYDCSSLDMIMLPDTVEELGYGAFYGCSSFTDVQLPDSLETIDNAAFMYCTKLETIDLSDSLMSIGGQAFSQCYKLRELSLPASLQTIEFDAFSDCKTLEELIIPLNVSSIGHGILNGTNDLQRVLVDINNQHYKSIDNVIYTRDGTKLVVCPGGMTNLTIADGTVEVLDDAGMNSANLTSISIPEGVTTIGRYAFRDCTKLTDISLPLSMETISLGAFEYCSRLVNIHYAGIEEQWLKIEIGTHNDSLLNARPHISVSGTVSYGNAPAVGIDVYLLYPNGSVKKHTTTNSTGTYMFQDVEVGSFVVRAADDSGNVSSSNIRVKRTGVFSSLVAGETNLKLKAAFCISGLVEPAEAYSISILDKKGNVRLTLNSDSAGQFIAAGLPNGTYVVKAENDNFIGTQEVTIFNNSTEITITAFERFSSIYGTTKILTRDGLHELRANVNVKLFDENGTIINQVLSDPTGKYQFSMLQKGNYYLVAQTSEIRNDPKFHIKFPYELTAYADVVISDSKDYCIDLLLTEAQSGSATISGTVKKGKTPQSGEVILCNWNGNQIAKYSVSTDGYYEFNFLEDGKYRITAKTAVGSGSIVVVVKHGEVKGNVDISVSKGNQTALHEEKVTAWDIQTREEALAYKEEIAEEKAYFDALSDKEKKKHSDEYVNLLNELIALITDLEVSSADGASVKNLAQIVSSDEITNEASVEFHLEVTGTDGWASHSTNKYYEIEANHLAGNGMVEAYYDISLTKDANGISEAVSDFSIDTDTTGSVLITLEIPEDQRGAEEYIMIHEHKGELATLVDLDNDPNTITFETSSFSTFALVSREKAIGSSGASVRACVNSITANNESVFVDVECFDPTGINLYVAMYNDMGKMLSIHIEPQLISGTSVYTYSLPENRDTGGSCVIVKVFILQKNTFMPVAFKENHLIA